MVGIVAWVSVAAVVLVLIAIVIWAILVLRGRALGTPGVVQRSRLTCPKCGGTFDYDWVPGASLTAVRLGTGRYMACPLCHKWSYFDIYSTMVERPPAWAGASSARASSAARSRPTSKPLPTPVL